MLTTFVLSQWVMPQAMFLRGTYPVAQAAEPRPIQTPPSSPSRKVSASGRGKAEKAIKVANTPKPPVWYVQARRKEAKRLEQTKQGMRMLLAQNTDVQKRGFTPPTVTNIPLAKTRAEAASGPALLSAEFPGNVLASAPLSPSPKISTVRLNLADDRVPTQSEIVAQGGLAGPLSPVAPAEPQQVEEAVNTELRKQGFGQGVETNIPTEAQVQGVPTLVARVRYFESAKKKVKEARDQNREFALAMDKWKISQFGAAAEDFKAYLEKYPKSPWAPEALIHIGNYAKYTGRGNEAESAYRQVIDATSDDPSDMSYNAHRKAFGRLTDLYIIQKRYNEASPMLEDFLYNDTNWRRRTWAMYWLTKITGSTTNPGARLAQLDCGTQALAVLLTGLNKPQQAQKVLKIKPTTNKGFSLADLRSIASREGVTLTGFSGTPAQLARLPLPVLLHYSNITPISKSLKKVANSPYGHYVVVRSYDAKRGLWKVNNPQDQTTSSLNATQLAREWSGRGLVLGQAIPTKVAVDSSKKPSVIRLSQAQMRTTYGTGFDVMGASDIGCCSENYPLRGNCGGANGCECQGEPGVSINRINQNIFMTDTPLWYSPAKGPKVNITISYNSLDATNYNPMVGNKWSFNYGSYLAEQANKVIVYRPMGGEDFMTSPATSGGTTTYSSPRGVYSKTSKTGSGLGARFTIQAQNGDQSIFGIPSGFSLTTPPVLLEMRDRWNQSLTFQYGLVNGFAVPFTITDADNKITRLQYDMSGHLIYVQTPDERQTSFSYDSYGNLIQCIDAAGQAFQYAYDATGNVVQLNTAQGPWTFAYEKTPQGTGFREYKTTVYDPMQDKPQVFGFTTQPPFHNPGQYYSLDHRGNKSVYVKTSLSDINTSITTDHISSITPSVGATINYGYDVASNSILKGPISISNGSTEVALTYNTQGKPTKMIQRVSSASWPMRTTTLTYDASTGLDIVGAVSSGQLTSGGAIQTQTILQSAIYNSQHLPTKTTDGSGHVTDYTYTAWGAIASVTVHEGSTNRVTTYNYGGATDPSNELNRLISVTYNGVTQATFTHDSSGRVKTVTDARGRTKAYRYNNLDKVVGTYYEDGTSELVDYACCSLPGMMTDRSGRRSYYDYDSLKRMIRYQDAAGQTLQFEYDADSNQTGMMDARGIWTRWSYDANNRPISKRYADGRVESTTYAPQGWVASTKNAQGDVTTYSHDWFGAITGIDYPNATSVNGDVTAGYDALGHMVSMSDATGSTSWGYDSTGRLESENGPWDNDTLTASYDSLDRLSGLTIGRDATTNDVMSYTYDSLSRLRTLSATAGGWGSLGTTTYNYMGDSTALDFVSLPNNTKRDYSYEAGDLQRLTSVQNMVTSTSANFSKFTYSYDSTGAPTGFRSNRTSQARKYGSETEQGVLYNHNATSMLTAEAGSGGGVSTPDVSKTYSYDTMSNRVQWADDANTRSDATYNRLNQLTTLSNYDTSTTTPTLTGTASYGYDADGNMTDAATYSATGTATGSTSYTYDDASRLTSITTLNTSKWVFIYDGLSRLRKSFEYSWNGTSWVLLQEKWRVCRGMDIVQERNGSNVVTASVIRDGNIGGILCRVTGSGLTNRGFYGYDGSGNVTTITNGSAGLLASYTYDAFGNIIANSGSGLAANPYRYSSKEQLGGMYYYGLRFYSPGLGRWINRDPIREAGGTNMYAFAGNSPLDKTDKYGLWTVAIGIGGGGGVGVGGGGGAEIHFGDSDCDGLSFGIDVPFSWGFMTPGVGVNATGAITNGDSGEDILGHGGSIGISTLIGGINWLFGGDLDNRTWPYGAQGALGVNLDMLPEGAPVQFQGTNGYTWGIGARTGGRCKGKGFYADPITTEKAEAIAEEGGNWFDNAGKSFMNEVGGYQIGIAPY